MKSIELNSADSLEALLKAARCGSRKFVTNFFASPPQREAWVRRGLRTLVATDRVLLLACDEERCTRMFFAGDLDEIGRVLAASEGARSLPCAVDLIGLPAQTQSLAGIFSLAGFHPHERLVRLSRGGKHAFAQDSAESRVCGAALSEDIPVILDLLRLNFDFYVDQIPQPAQIAEAIEAGAIRVARSGSLDAFLWFERTGVTALIRYWCVSSAARGRGIGSLLMRDYFERTEDCARHLLWVREKNTHASNCYQHYGYAPDGLEDHVMVLE